MGYDVQVQQIVAQSLAVVRRRASHAAGVAITATNSPVQIGKSMDTGPMIRLKCEQRFSIFSGSE